MNNYQSHTPQTPEICDVLLMTVNDIETDAVLTAFEAATGLKPKLQFGKKKTYFSLGTLSGAKVTLVRSEMGSDTKGGATLTTRDALDEVKPKAIIMVGVAFGIDSKKQSIGEILVSSQIQNYELQRIGSRKGSKKPVIIPRGDKVTASEMLIDRFKTGKVTWTIDSKPNIDFCLVLSGLKLVDNIDYRDSLIAQFPEAKGGEMEANGVYIAADKVDWIIVKAICDWADGNKSRNKKKRQQVAAKNAAEFVLHTIAQGGVVPPDGNDSKGQATFKAMTNVQNNQLIGDGKQINIQGDIKHYLENVFINGADVGDDLVEAIIKNYQESRKVKRYYPSVSHFSLLSTKMNSLPRISRDSILEKIVELHLGEVKVVISGGPGVGKSFLLGEIKLRCESAYFSLRGKTTQQALLDIAHFLAKHNGNVLPDVEYEDEIKHIIEHELSQTTNPLSILIDHVDQNIPASQILNEIDVFSNHLLFAARPENLKFIPGIVRVDIPALSREEIIQFLDTREIFCAPGSLEQIVTASQGNVLYLDYFTRYQISPLPEGLSAYQDALWNQYDSETKEILSLASYSLEPLNTEDFNFLLSEGRAYNIIKTAELLNNAAGVLNANLGVWEIFHPFFQEHIISENKKIGLGKHFHSRLAKLSIEKRNVVATANHLLKAHDPRAARFVKPAIYVAQSQGEWLLAEEFVNYALKNVNGDKAEEAHLLHALTAIYGDMGKRNNAIETAEKAVALYEELGDEDSKKLIETYASTLWIDAGEPEKAINTLEKIVASFKDYNEHYQAAALSNLSYAYLQTGRGIEGLDAATKASEIFKKMGDLFGEKASLLNISACIGSLDWRNFGLQREWAEKVINRAKELNDLRLLAGGLNHLARVQRREGDSIGAQKSSEEAIAICQQLGAIDIEITNILNLGNAFVDQKQYKNAEAAASEAFQKAVENKLIRQEALALELKAKVKNKLELPDQAIPLALNALKIYEKIGDVLRQATTYEKLSRSYELMGNRVKAAESYEYSAMAYQTCREWFDASSDYESAAEIWKELGNQDKATECALLGAKCGLLAFEPGYAVTSLIHAETSNPNVGQLYLEILEQYLSVEKQDYFSTFMYNLTFFCKSQSDHLGKSIFLNSIHSCVESLSKRYSYRVVNGLAIGIEQSKNLISADELIQIGIKLSSIITGYHFTTSNKQNQVRQVKLDIFDSVTVKLYTESRVDFMLRLLLAISLILIGNKSFLREVLDKLELSDSLEENIEVSLVTSGDALLIHGFRLPRRSKDLVSWTILNDVPWGLKQPPVIFAIDTDYDEISDRFKNFHTKAFPWTILDAFRVVASYATHRHQDLSIIQRTALDLCEFIFNFRK